MQNLAPRIFNIIAYLIIAHVYNQFSSTSIPPITSLGFLLKKKNVYFRLCWAFVAVQAFLQLQQAGLLFSCCAQLLMVVASSPEHGRGSMWASVVAMRGLKNCSSCIQGLVALWRISWTCVSCVSRWTEAPGKPYRLPMQCLPPMQSFSLLHFGSIT